MHEVRMRQVGIFTPSILDLLLIHSPFPFARLLDLLLFGLVYYIRTYSTFFFFFVHAILSENEIKDVQFSSGSISFPSVQLHTDRGRSKGFKFTFLFPKNDLALFEL